MAKYRKIEVRTWGDQRFRELSAPQPNARTLWLYLLCGPRTTMFPGIVLATPAVMASDLGWPLDPELDLSGSCREKWSGPRALSEAWLEIAEKGMARADWGAGVVVLPKALFDSSGDVRETSHPGSPNALAGWAKAWDDIPECQLKTEYMIELASFAKALGPNYLKAYGKAFGTAWSGRGAVGERSGSGRGLATPSGTGTGTGSILISALAPDLPVAVLSGAPDPDLGLPLDRQPVERGGPERVPTPPGQLQRAAPRQAPTDSRPDFATDPGFCNRPRILQPPPDPTLTYDPSNPRAVGQLAEAIYRQVSDHRIAIAAELGLPAPIPFPTITPSSRPGSFRELQDRVREEGAMAPLVCARIVANLVAQAREDRGIEWLAEKVFGEGAWRTARDWMPANSRPARAGPRSVPFGEHPQLAAQRAKIARLEAEEDAAKKGTAT